MPLPPGDPRDIQDRRRLGSRALSLKNTSVRQGSRSRAANPSLGMLPREAGNGAGRRYRERSGDLSYDAALAALTLRSRGGR